MVIPMHQSEAKLDKAQRWWNTEIIEIKPGEIYIRGYPIQELIGQLSFAQMIWLMLRGDIPSTAQAHLLESALVAAVDHGPQAPSIAIARMAATCGTGLNNAMGSAINVLGDVHGGAGQQCMELLQQVNARSEGGVDLATATSFELDEFTKRHGKIIPGFGHRFHPVDPRVAPLLERVKRAVERGDVRGAHFAVAGAIHDALRHRTGRTLSMNIDGVTAVIYCELGFPPPLGRGLFVLSRSVGILAHAWEQEQRGERIKGPMPKEIPYTYSGPARRHLKNPVSS